MVLRIKYTPLTRYLAGLPSDQQTVTLTFAELEQLLGSALPASAWIAYYWAGSSVARANWQVSGFTAKLDRRGQRIIFSRRPERSSAR